VYVGRDPKFIHDDIGYPELQALFEFFTELTGARPPLVEAGELLAEPRAIMRMYCESAIHDRFEPSMLEWRAGRIEEFAKWAGWHEEAQHSTGFNQAQKTKDNTDDLVLPDDVQQLIEQSMPIYDTLREFRMRV
jgi:hypothetical protein